MKLDALFRAAALLSMLVAGSCSVANDGTPSTISEDGDRNHPITVEPSYRELKIQFAGGGAGVSADDAVKFDAFLADYRTHGNGSLGISVPNGAPAHAAITFFAERAAATGISRDKILVSTHDVANGDFRVDVSYIAYKAERRQLRRLVGGPELSPPENQTRQEFRLRGAAQYRRHGCRSPRSGGSARGGETPIATRRGVIVDLYEQGKPSAATKRTPDLSVEQSAPGSDIGAN